MQNVGAISIIAELDSPYKNSATGLAVFYRNYTYDEHGFIEGDLPRASDVPVVYYKPADGTANTDYRICGLTLVDNLKHERDGQTIDVRATVFVSGAVLFCNTGQDPISAGDEVWVKMGSYDNIEDKHVPPVTVGRSLGEQRPATDYVYLGRCLVGAVASVPSAKRLCFGQVLLGLFAE